MRALRLPGPRLEPVLVEVEPPVPGPGEVVVRVEAAGVCRSDLHVIDAGGMGFPTPFTLGHEVAGRVFAVGPTARGVEVGDAVVVYGPWGCGRCPRCVIGRDNYCDRRAELSWAGIGLGRDGGMAEYVRVPAARYLEPIGDLDPVQAAPLSDAGLTAYHAIQSCRPRLQEGSTAAVIGVGGLGHLAVQLLRALTPSRVFAVDVRSSALALAERSGAELCVPASPDAARVLRVASGGSGIDAVFDFAATDASLRLAASVVRADGDLVIVGSGGGSLTIAKPGRHPHGCRVSLPFWGTRAELTEVVRLAQSGVIRVEAQRFPLSAAMDAIGQLRAGALTGRAVITPGDDSD